MEKIIEKNWYVEKSATKTLKKDSMDYSCDFTIINNKTILELAFKITSTMYQVIIYCEFYVVFNDKSLSQDQMLSIAYAATCNIIQERLANKV